METEDKVTLAGTGTVTPPIVIVDSEEKEEKSG